MILEMERWLGIGANVALGQSKLLIGSAVQLEDIVYYFLCAAYASVSIVALVLFS
jgi:hypothetical protein